MSERTEQSETPSRTLSQEAFAEAVRAWTPALLGSAWSLGWSGADADDLVQDTFLTYLRNPAHFEGRSSLKTYLIGILYKKSLERRRAVAREQAADPVDAVFESRFGWGGAWRTMPRAPEDLAEAHETMALLDRCLDTLPAVQRMAFYLRDIEQESTETICKILDITVTHSGVLLFRARNRIRECMQNLWRGKA